MATLKEMTMARAARYGDPRPPAYVLLLQIATGINVVPHVAVAVGWTLRAAISAMGNGRQPSDGGRFEEWDEEGTRGCG
jgi:hypothetical protein